MYRAILLSLSIVSLPAASLRAQDVPLLEPGDRVRVSAGGDFYREFSFMESRSDYLVLTDTLTAGLRFIPAGEVTELEVSLGRRSISRAVLLKGTIGALLGASAVAVVALAKHGASSIGASSLEWGVAGAMVGTMVGLMRRGEVWKDTWSR